MRLCFLNSTTCINTIHIKNIRFILLAYENYTRKLIVLNHWCPSLPNMSEITSFSTISLPTDDWTYTHKSTHLKQVNRKLPRFSYGIRNDGKIIFRHIDRLLFRPEISYHSVQSTMANVILYFFQFSRLFNILTHHFDHFRAQCMCNNFDTIARKLNIYIYRKLDWQFEWYWVSKGNIAYFFQVTISQMEQNST